ncbi:MAG TPA: type II toxin-antitoxin system HicB family antitoxin [Gemmataceae bacterium]|jgi:predicted RNase H-like HicB family nuclease
MSKRLTAVIRREGDGFVALCPELDVASQGDTVEAARDNLREALDLFFECAPPRKSKTASATRCSSPRSRWAVGRRRCP